MHAMVTARVPLEIRDQVKREAAVHRLVPHRAG